MANDLESSIRELAESRARKVELAEWLTTGLRARASEPPVVIALPVPREEPDVIWMSQLNGTTEADAESVPMVAERAPAVVLDAGLGLDAASTDAPTPRVPRAEDSPASETPDTLQPHLLSKDLEDEDFAVLPSKPSLRVVSDVFAKLPLRAAWQAVQRRPALRRSAAAAVVLLLLGGLTLVRRSEAPAQLQTELAAVQPEAHAEALPPVDESEAAVLPSVTPPVTTTKGQGRRVAAPSAPFTPTDAELDGPRGPNVARYPDLPQRVLTRLATTQSTARRSEPDPTESASDAEKPTWLLDNDR